MQLSRVRVRIDLARTEGNRAAAPKPTMNEPMVDVGDGSMKNCLNAKRPQKLPMTKKCQWLKLEKVLGNWMSKDREQRAEGSPACRCT